MEAAHGRPYPDRQRGEGAGVDLVNVTRELLRHKRLLVASIIVAVLAAAATEYRLSPLPPSAKARSLEYAAAQTQILVDVQRSPVADVAKEFDPLVARAGVYAKLMTSAEVMDVIGKEAGVPGAAIIASAPVEANQPKAAKEPGTEQRGVQLLGEAVPLRLFFADEEGQPIITISSQAPTAEQAVNLANAAVSGFKQYIERIQNREAVKQTRRVRLKQLGPATGGIVNEGASKAAMLMVFLATLTLCCLLILFVSSLRRGWRDEADAFPGPPRAASPQGGSSSDLILTGQWPGDGGGEPVGPRATTRAPNGNGHHRTRSRHAS
jgi:hypothetical protein